MHGPSYKIREIISFIETCSVIWWQTLEVCTWNWSISFKMFSHYEVCNSVSRMTTFELNCSKTCNCDRDKFSPVCGRDKYTYFSACYAGCQNTTLVDGKVVSVSLITVFVGNTCFTIHWFMDLQKKCFHGREFMWQGVVSHQFEGSD
jgi:hypothetical protein